MCTDQRVQRACNSRSDMITELLQWVLTTIEQLGQNDIKTKYV